ncbi:hypothetical protein [Aneurinibacillus sp. REN35]|uniref:hypothetical protein n=1 Tax=Aneurinibacillus sp. REN35 TaxID=3237286 RepID=UPI00198006FE|nr:hypothetical protein [Aneurinibacillus sp. BA2021]
MKHAVVIPERAKVRHIVVSLESLLGQLNKAEQLDLRITGLRINGQARAIEVETEEMPDEKLL